MSDTLNGYEVVGSYRISDQPGLKKGRIVLVDRGVSFSEPFVTAFHGNGDEGWGQGHYFSEFRNAVADFAKRIIDSE